MEIIKEKLDKLKYLSIEEDGTVFIGGIGGQRKIDNAKRIDSRLGRTPVDRREIFSNDILRSKGP